jgi:hypothetical protein
VVLYIKLLTTFQNVPPVLPVRLQGRDAPVVPITFNTKISEKPIWKIVGNKKISKLPGHTSCLGFQLHKHLQMSCSAQDNRKDLDGEFTNALIEKQKTDIWILYFKYSLI